MNGNIRAREVRVVAPDGSQVGVKTLQEAIWLADQLGLDLVEVAPGAKPPVCKIMDYGKFKYENSVRDREARKKQTKTVIKEVRMKPRIGDHDYEILLKRAMLFLSEGDKVKVTVRFRGRENQRPELGFNLVRRLVDDVGEYATIEQSPQKDGRTMSGVLAPTTAAKKLGKEGVRRFLNGDNDEEPAGEDDELTADDEGSTGEDDELTADDEGSTGEDDELTGDDEGSTSEEE